MYNFRITARTSTVLVKATLIVMESVIHVITVYLLPIVTSWILIMMGRVIFVIRMMITMVYYIY
jgi:hypothetical protein